MLATLCSPNPVGAGFLRQDLPLVLSCLLLDDAEIVARDNHSHESTITFLRRKRRRTNR